MQIGNFFMGGGGAEIKISRIFRIFKFKDILQLCDFLVARVVQQRLSSRGQVAAANERTRKLQTWGN